MNIALLLAGGSGVRMHQAVPKQFMCINDKPVIIYTLEAFEKHPAIDEIVVVCLEGWEHILETYARQFQITKLKHVTVGGVDAQESTIKGIDELRKYYSDDDITIIHDGNRPLVSAELISDCIAQTKKHGCAIAAIPCADAMMETEDGLTSMKYFQRGVLRRTQRPHGFRIGTIHEIYEKALERGIRDSIASCTLMADLGIPVYFSLGSEKNIKLTTVEDVEIFKALIQVGK